MADIEAIKGVSQLDGCIMIKYQVFMTNLILSLDLINNQFGVTIGFKVLYPYLLSKLMSRTLYSATLLEQDSVNEKVQGIT